MVPPHHHRKGRRQTTGHRIKGGKIKGIKYKVKGGFFSFLSYTFSLS